MSGLKFVLIVLVCAVGLWLAIELVLTAASFVLACVMGREQREEIARGRLNPARAMGAFLVEFGAASLTHLLVAVMQTFTPRKSRLTLNVRTTPILLVPGYFCNRGCWIVFSRLLLRLGASQTYTIDPKRMTADIRDLARQVGDKVEAILSATRASRVNLVGHSMGGLMARYYIEQLGGASKVGVCVTLASPHHGTHLSQIGLGTNAKQMRPGSEFLTDLDRFEHIGKETKYVSIWSTFDNMVVPPTSSILGGNAKNITLHYMGHLTTLYSPNVARLVWENLTQ